MRILLALIVVTGCTELPGVGEDGGPGCVAKDPLAVGEVCIALDQECERCMMGFTASRTTSIDISNFRQDGGSLRYCEDTEWTQVTINEGPVFDGYASFQVVNCRAGNAPKQSGSFSMTDGGVAFDIQFAPHGRSTATDCAADLNSPTTRCGDATKDISAHIRGNAPWYVR